jgi:hypothetical protein
MTESKVPGSTDSTGSTGASPVGGGWASVLPAVVLLLRAGVTDGQLSHLTDLRVRVQRGAFAADGGPERGPSGGPSGGPERRRSPDADRRSAGRRTGRDVNA